MPFLLRKAIVLIVGVKLSLTLDGDEPGEFKLAVSSRIPWFKIREAFPVSGEARRHMRRDMRGGGATGRIALTHGGMRMVASWGEPFAGGEHAEFSISPDGRVLSVLSKSAARRMSRAHLSLTRGRQSRCRMGGPRRTARCTTRNPDL